MLSPINIFSNLDWHAIGIEDSSHGKENEFSIIGFYVSIFGRSATASLTWRSKEETHVFSLTSGKTPETVFDQSFISFSLLLPLTILLLSFS
jgi:hypothetical protein